MNIRRCAQLMLAAILCGTEAGQAAPIAYWNIFNVEDESHLNAAIVTYDTLTDMLNDTNRTGLYVDTGAFASQIVGGDSDGTTFWNLFNIEGEANLNAAFVTYSSLIDMLNDTNRTGLYPDTGAFGGQIVGTGSNGSTYWNLFNIEGETNLNAAFVTYSSLIDMLNDTNRTGLYPDTGAFGGQIVGTGSNGSTYWNLFNIEGETSLNAAFVTYSSLTDMLNDTNRTGVYSGTGAFGSQIVGMGAFFSNTTPVPEPSTLLMLIAAVAGLVFYRRACQPASPDEHRFSGSKEFSTHEFERTVTSARLVPGSHTRP